MTKHTQGKWSQESDGTLVMAGQLIAQPIWLAPDGAPKDEALANARLIAAAPEMFELLEMMAEGTLINWEPGNPYKTPLDVVHTYQRMARAAIAKATGA